MKNTAPLIILTCMNRGLVLYLGKMIELKKYLLYSQAALLISIVICSLIIPSVVTNEGGISNFGNYISTFFIYSLGFILNIIFIYLAAKVIINKSQKLLYVARGLMILSLLTLLVYLSTFPRHLSFAFSDIHDYLGIALYVYELIIALYILNKLRKLSIFVILVVQISGSLIGLLSIYKLIDWLYVGQLVGAIAFSFILAIGLPEYLQKAYSEKLPKI